MFHSVETSIKIWQAELSAAKYALTNPHFRSQRHKIEAAIRRAEENIAKLKANLSNGND